MFVLHVQGGTTHIEIPLKALFTFALWIWFLQGPFDGSIIVKGFFLPTGFV